MNLNKTEYMRRSLIQEQVVKNQGYSISLINALSVVLSQTLQSISSVVTIVLPRITITGRFIEKGLRTGIIRSERLMTPTCFLPLKQKRVPAHSLVISKFYASGVEAE